MVFCKVNGKLNRSGTRERFDMEGGGGGGVGLMPRSGVLEPAKRGSQSSWGVRGCCKPHPPRTYFEHSDLTALNVLNIM